MYLIANGKLITRDSAMPYLENGGVAVEGAKILEVGETAALKAKYPQAEFIDAKGMVIMPAFINAHSHIYTVRSLRSHISANHRVYTYPH